MLGVGGNRGEGEGEGGGMKKPEGNITENNYNYYGPHYGKKKPPHMLSASTLETQNGGMGDMG